MTLKRAVVFTFLAHGAAMLGMLIFLLPMIPGGGVSDLDRVAHIAASLAGPRSCSSRSW